MSLRTEILLWARRVTNSPDATPHQLLEIKEGATLDEIQTAFHSIARRAHPDLHRTALSADELELVTSAYSRVAGAYQDLRMQTARIKPLKANEAPNARSAGTTISPLTGEPLPVRAGSPTQSPVAARTSSTTIQPRPKTTQAPPLSRTSTATLPPRERLATPSGNLPQPVTTPMSPVSEGLQAAKASEQMNSKALVCYRKAEIALRRGDLRGAVLQLKLAIAADPTSAFLRSALTEVESEVSK